MATKRQPRHKLRLALADYCERSGITQQELSARTGIPQSAISRDMSGQRQITDARLAKYLQAVEPTRRKSILDAWLADTLPRDLLQHVQIAGLPDLAGDGLRVAEQMPDEWTESARGLLPGDAQKIRSLIARASQDREITDMLLLIYRRLS
jgi:transcriptional regulator with XRE-family HTH domain